MIDARKLLKYTKEELESVLYNLEYIRRRDKIRMIPVIVEYENKEWGCCLMLVPEGTGLTYTLKSDVMFKVEALHRRFVIKNEDNLVRKETLNLIHNRLNDLGFQ